MHTDGPLQQWYNTYWNNWKHIKTHLQTSTRPAKELVTRIFWERHIYNVHAVCSDKGHDRFMVKIGWSSGNRTAGCSRQYHVINSADIGIGMNQTESLTSRYTNTTRTWHLSLVLAFCFALRALVVVFMAALLCKTMQQPPSRNSHIPSFRKSKPTSRVNLKSLFTVWLLRDGILRVCVA